MIRRQPLTRPENQLQLALDEIARLKAMMSKITDGRQLVLNPTDSTPGSPTTPPVEAAPHVLYGSKHTRSLRVTAGAGLNINFEQGQIWMGGVFFSIGAGSLLMTDATTNYVFVNTAGAVASNTTGFPNNSCPLATVVTAGGAITSVNDRRSYLAGGVHGAGLVLGNPLIVGVDDTTRGEVHLMGDGAASDEGGELRLYLAADHDTTFQYWTVDAWQDDLRFFRSDAPWTLTLTAEGILSLGATAVGSGIIIGASPGTFRSLFRYVGGNVFEVKTEGDNISLRLLTNASQTAGVVPGAVELQAGAGLNSQGGAINITAGAGVAGAAPNHAGGIIGITAGDAVGTGVGGIINLTAGKSPSGADGAIAMRLRGAGIADISPEWRIQQDQNGAGDFQTIFSVINTGMSALLGGLALGNMLDLQNEGDNAPEFGAVGGQYADWTATAYDNGLHDSRNVTYLISPRDKAIYLWNLHTHGTAEEFLKVFWTGNVLKIVTDKTGTGSYRDLTLDAGNGNAAPLNLFGHNVILRARDTANGIFLDLPEAAGASFVKVRDSAFAEVFKINSDGVSFWGGDANFSIGFAGTNPRWTMDSGDYIQLQRAGNIMEMVLGAAGTWQVVINAATQILAGTSQVQFLGNSSAFDSTGLIKIGGDTLFQIGMVGAEPRITVDTGDYYRYDRTGNFHSFNIGNVSKLAIGNTQIDVGVDGSAPVLILHAIDGVNEGGELQLLGAAANTDWSFDNFAGTLRWHEGGAVDMELTDVGQLRLPIGGSAAGLLMGGDALLYRSAADNFYSPDRLTMELGFISGSGNSVDNQLLLQFNIDRAWQFEVDGEGATTRLVLRSLVDDKSFVIQSLDSTDVMQVHTDDQDESWMRFTGQYIELLSKTTMTSTPSTDFLKWMAFEHSGRTAPTWREDTGVQWMAEEKARVVFPLPIDGESGLNTGVQLVDETAQVYLVHIESPVQVEKISYNVNLAGANADNVVRIAIYLESGQTKVIDVTDAVGTATGVRTITLGTATWLHPGNYYVFICLSSGTEPGPQVDMYTSVNTLFTAGGAGEPDVGGALTITAGAAPATFDPTAITTPTASRCVALRLDGAA